jgi:endonuclease/exonuclease/phosphatase (EEP) superfamily protein YafD
MKFLSGKAAVAAKELVIELRQAWIERSAARRAIDLFVAAMFGGLALVSAAGVASSWLPSLETFGDLQGHFAGGAAALAIAGLVARSRVCVRAAALLLAANLVAIEYRVDSVDTCPVQTAATGQHVLRVMTLNIWNQNHDFAAVESAVARHRPDIVVLEEVQPYHEALLAQLRAGYPHQASCDSHPDCGISILSKFPLKVRPVIGGHRLSVLKAAITLDNRQLLLVGTHMRRPFDGRTQLGQFDDLKRTVAALPANAIVVGDFNSTLWSANMAHYAKGAGICASNLAHATWPEWLGPFGVPIDHVFLKHGVRLLSIATVPNTGSDHKGIVATLSMR